MAFTIVNKQQYAADPEGYLNTLSEDDWFAAEDDAIDAAGDRTGTLLVLFRDSNGEISEDSTLLGQDAQIDALNELGTTGSAKLSGTGEREFWTRREENADWRFVGVVSDAIQAQETIDNYHFGFEEEE